MFGEGSNCLRKKVPNKYKIPVAMAIGIFSLVKKSQIKLLRLSFLYHFSA